MNIPARIVYESCYTQTGQIRNHNVVLPGRE